MKYSYVIPCYNSELTIRDVVEEIIQKMKDLKENSFEIVLINDFSKDNTKIEIFNLANEFENITAINLSKNFGQHSAIMAGFNEVKGDFIICLDDDGQTPANQVDRLIDKLSEGYDVIFASYKNKKHSSFRNFGSKVNDYMAKKLINKPDGLYLSSYFIARKYVVDEIIKYKNPFPYISGLILRTTSLVANVDVEHRNRKVGESGYTFTSLFKLWLNGFTAFSIKPLRLSVYLGFIVALIGALFSFYSVLSKITNPQVPVGWTSIIAILSIVGGTILIILGMIGEYIGRIYISINNAPQYIIREKKE